MRRNPRPLILGVCLTLAVALPAYAKRPIERITIAGPGLAKPLEVTDRELLTLSNPWFGKFADWSRSIEGRPQATPVYEVTLYARLREAELTPIYQFRYAPGSSFQPGHVYLPGRGEPWYRQNVSVILRSGHDGRWHLAGPTWEAGIKRALGRE